jgi:hypothetical protein
MIKLLLASLTAAIIAASLVYYLLRAVTHGREGFIPLMTGAVGGAALVALLVFASSAAVGVAVNPYFWREPAVALSVETPSTPSSRSINSVMDDQLIQAWKELKSGLIAYEPSRTMTQGVPENVLVRISRGGAIDADSGFTHTAWVEAMRVSGTMTAKLSGNPQDFEIVPLSTGTQAVVEASDWLWRVTPLRSGALILNLTVTARISLSDSRIESRDELVKAAEITVATDYWWLTKRFVKSNWQWLLGSPVVVGGAFAWVFRRRRDKRRAGFQP